MEPEPEPEPEEAMTKEELEDTAAEPVKNAFAQLMSTRPRPTVSGPSRAFKDRLALGAFIASPASFPPSSVIYFNDGFVAIRDKFPKATLHALLLPRSGAHTLLHPFDALADPAFLAAVRAEARGLAALVAGELQRRLGPYSCAEAARQAVLDGGDPPPSSSSSSSSHASASASAAGSPSSTPSALPPGRDWAAEVRAGVHAVPSMGNLHIHVLSRDMHSPAMKHRKHYNSFNTPFFVDLDDFPLHELDPRRDPGREGFLRRDLRCWRCGQNFGNRFRELKAHLETEFEAWKME
ncbi:Aprataxin-like protein [Escovopsis weberi]|uniref:Aprataxin-like protein n=1 Tax=Escovopsis weberi TaxID=150374 RepID=A0A0M8N1C4_ESCWE|nr:Aprataxin-like protein [Escovopsis weberi]